MTHDTLSLRPMTAEDLARVLAIITEHDEDDGAAAEASYAEAGFDRQFVLVNEHDEVLGVTGYRPAQGTDATAWLSWTYVDEAARGRGAGKEMLTRLFEVLREAGIRKVFTSTSDYVDEEDGDIYAAARRMYEDLGFREELRHADYYEPGETQLIYGLRLNGERADVQIAEDDTCVFFNRLHEIAEADDIYAIGWQVVKPRLFQRPNQFTPQDLAPGIEQARNWEARALFISFPSNMVSVQEPLQAAGFIEAGRLSDFYEDGLDEIHFRLNL